MLLLKHCRNGPESLAELNEVRRNVSNYFSFSHERSMLLLNDTQAFEETTTFRNPLTKYITYGCIEYTSAQPEVELTSSVVIGNQRRFKLVESVSKQLLKMYSWY